MAEVTLSPIILCDERLTRVVLTHTDLICAGRNGFLRTIRLEKGGRKKYQDLESHQQVSHDEAHALITVLFLSFWYFLSDVVWFGLESAAQRLCFIRRGLHLFGLHNIM